MFSLIEGAIRTTFAFSQISGSIFGTSPEELNAATRAKVLYDLTGSHTAEHLPSAPEIWDCSPISPVTGDKIPNAVSCITEEDYHGNLILRVGFTVPEGLTGPGFALAPIDGTMQADGEGIALLTYHPSPGVNVSGDAACGLPTNFLFRHSNIPILPLDGSASTECFDAFSEPKTFSLLGPDGQEHLITVKPPGMGESTTGDTALVRFKTASDGRIFILFGPADNTSYTSDLLWVHDSELVNAEKAGARLTKFLHDTPNTILPTPPGGYKYPTITLPPELIARFPLTYPPVEATPNPELFTATSEVPPGTIDGLLTPNPIPPETLPAMLPEQRLLGPQTVSSIFYCYAGDRILGYEADLDSPAAKALQEAAAKDGWHPGEIAEALVALRKEEKTENPNIFEKVLQSLGWQKAKPKKINSLSCTDADLSLNISPLTTMIDREGNTIIIGTNNLNGKIIYLVVPPNLAPDRLKTQVSVNGVLDVDTTAELAKQSANTQKNQYSGPAAQPWGTIISFANRAAVSEQMNLDQVIIASRTANLGGLYPARVIDSDGDHVIVNIPTSFVTQPIGYKTVGDTHYIVLEAKMIDMLTPEMTPEIQAQIVNIFGGEHPNAILVMIPVIDTISSYSAPSLAPTPTPEVHNTTPLTRRQLAQKRQQNAWLQININRQIARGESFLTCTL